MRRILVAEDNDSNFILMGYLLKKHYEVIRAINGIDAVEKVEQGGIDMVLMDLKMPEMDGLQATRIIKEKYPELIEAINTVNILTCLSSHLRPTLSAATVSRLSKPVATSSFPNP